MKAYLLMIFVLYYLWIGHCAYSVMTYLGSRRGALPWLFNLVFWPLTLMLIKDRLDAVNKWETDK